MQAVIWKGLFWLTAEAFLTFVGLDNLADYSEFIFRFKDSLTLERQRVERLLCQPRLATGQCLALQPGPNPVTGAASSFNFPVHSMVLS